MRTNESENPLTGAGILRYFKEEKGIKIEPMVFVGIAVAFVVFELILKVI